MNRFARVVLSLCAVSVGPLAAQGPAFDTSGNGLLSGTYYFRHVIYVISTSADVSGYTGDITEAIVSYGAISFDGNGNYSTSNSVLVDSSSGQSPLSASGKYSISASGYGFLSNPVVNGDSIFGLVSANGVFVGSSTETAYSYSDLFIAAPLASPLPGNSSFQGGYTVAGFLPGGNPLNSADVFFPMNPDGQGNLGTVSVTGYYGGGGTKTLSQTSSNVRYSFSSGAAVVTFPTSSTANFFSGQEILYFSPDGNFFFGGSPTDGFDMLVGVRNGAGTENFGGLFYEAGIDQDVSQLLGTGYANFDAYYGSFNATSAGNIVLHERLNSVFNANAYGTTFNDTYPTPPAGTYTDTASSFQYAVAAGGAVRIGQGIGPYLGINVALQAPAFSGPGVYLNPTGIVNAASFAPFTAGISNGEFITLFGTNLAQGTFVATSVPFPPSLGGVQVLINGVAAPIYYVTQGQLAVIVPAGNTFPVAQIQVINNGVASNVVTEFVGKTAPGVFTLSNTGNGYAAAVHPATGSIVTPDNPAAPGETIEVFVSGLGIVFPTVPDGAAPPLDPLSYTTNTIAAAISGAPATVTFAGLAPQLAGLYQVNVTIPATAAAGENTLNISGPDSYTSQTLISVGASATAASVRQQPAVARKRATSAGLAHRPLPCLISKPACALQ
jgi:uncharacterized protein (TIGR03437 family)